MFFMIYFLVLRMFLSVAHGEWLSSLPIYFLVTDLCQQGTFRFSERTILQRIPSNGQNSQNDL